VRLNDVHVNKLMDMIVGGCVHFGTLDSITLEAFINPTSLVGNTRSRDDVKKRSNRSKRHIFLPFHHRQMEHWTLFHIDKFNHRITHYDSLGSGSYEKAEAQAKEFLSWSLDQNFDAFELRLERV
jgi:hypothetical protein